MLSLSSHISSRVFILLTAILLLEGCAEVRLNENTNSISKTVVDLYKEQALDNFSRLIDDPNGIPSFIDLSAGTVQTTDTVNPSLTFPLTPQVVNTATGITLMHGNTTAGAGAGINAMVSQQQNWNVTPLTNANSLRNLRALYDAALYGSDLTKSYHPAQVLVDNVFYNDPYQLREPQCVLCAPEGTVLKIKPKLSINPRLHKRWIFWKLEGSKGEDGYLSPDTPRVDLGQHGTRHLYMTAKSYHAGYLDDFVLFVLPNAAITEVFVPASATGVGSSSSKNKDKGGSGGKDAAGPGSAVEGRPTPKPGRFFIAPFTLDIEPQPAKPQAATPPPAVTLPAALGFPAGARPEAGRGINQFINTQGIQN